MIVVIRISGLVDVRKDVVNTLNIMRLRRKFSCILLNPTAETGGMLKKVNEYAAYGPIDEKTLKELIMKRGKKQGNKPADKITDESVKNLMDGKTTLKELGIKPFFRLHPPIGGFKKSTKVLYPRGILGSHKEKINQLITKML